MSFVPVTAGGGLSGWQFLARTYTAQRSAFAAAPRLDRDIAHFRQTIGSVRSASDLVADRQLLTVALGAFGLGDDLNNRYFVRRILEEGTTSRDSLANRMSDARYRRLSAAFGLGPGETRRTGSVQEMAAVADRFVAQSFEIAVGAQDPDLRLALHARRELPDIAARPLGDDAKWFTMMSLPPLRSLFETAFGLPAGFGGTGIDQQMRTFRDKARSAIGVGDFSGFADPDAGERLIRLFLARSQAGRLAATLSPAGTALTLLGSAGIPR